MADHEFETMIGDELSVRDLKGATWRVQQTYADVDESGTLVFTHRIEIQTTDDQMIDTIRRHLGMPIDASPQEIKAAIEKMMEEDDNG